MPPKAGPSGGLKRTTSGRNKAKGLAVGNKLGGTPPAKKAQVQTPANYTLVVLGATDPRDHWIFADFMAFCKFFTQIGSEGTYYSCFPIDEAWGVLSNLTPIVDTIKFGHTNANINSPPILTYTRWQYTHYDPFWIQVRHNELKTKVLEWIRAKTVQAVPGDTVNIVFESHASIEDGIKLGSQDKASKMSIFLSEWEFERELRPFKVGVQVNAIMGACHSGKFKERIACSGQQNRYVSVAAGADQLTSPIARTVSNRCRGSRWELTWIQSLASVSRHGMVLPTNTPPKSVAEHEQFIKDNIHNLGTPRTPQSPEWYTTGPLTQAIESLIFLDKIDVVYDTTVSSRRRRVELPSLSVEFQSMIQNANNQLVHLTPSPQVKQDVITLLEEECKSVDADGGWLGDVAIFDTYNPPQFPTTDTVKLGQVLVVLYWRARAQSAFLDMFCLLVSREYLSLDGLRVLMGDWTSKDAIFVDHVLWSFTGLGGQDTMENSLIDPHHMRVFRQWFATMIVRGFRGDLHMLFETIAASQFFGVLDEKKFSRALQMAEDEKHDMCVHYDPKCNTFLRSGVPEDKEICLGYALPHNLGHITDAKIYDTIADTYAHFDRIERNYKRYFNIADNQLITAEMQAHCLDSDPRRVESRILSMSILRREAYRKASGAL